MITTRLMGESREFVEDKERKAEPIKKIVIKKNHPKVGEAFRKKFEDLANTRAEFKNVGVVKTPDSEGSGVYIASRLVITSASILPHGFLSNTYILPNEPQITFSVEDQKGVKQTARVIFGTRHPDFQEDYHKKFVFNPKNDIALLLLDHEFKNLEPITVNFHSSQDETNCIAVGYTNQYPTPLEKDKRVPIFKSRESVKIATVFPSLSYLTDLGLHRTVLGYPSSSFVGSFCCCIPVTYSSINLTKPHNDPHEIGVCNGMLGGGYFDERSLVGITVLSLCPAFSGDGEGLSNQLSDEVFCVPLSLHHEWIKTTVDTYEEKLPELDKKIDDWNKKNRKNPESKEDKRCPPDDPLLKIVNKFVSSLIAFKKKHLKPKDTLLNAAIDKFLKKDFKEWYETVSDIQNALLNKGYSVKHPTFFGGNDNNIIGDIQEIIYLTNDIFKGVKLNPKQGFK